MFEPVLKNPWVQAIIAALGLVLLVYLAKLLDFVLIPLFFAFILAYIFDPVADLLEQRKVPRMNTALLLLAMVALMLLSVPLLILPETIQETVNFAASMQTQLSSNQWLAKLPLKELVELLGWQALGATPAEALSVGFERFARTQGLQFVQSHLPELQNVGQIAGSSALSLFSAIGSGILSVVLFIGNLALFIFMVIYLLKDFDHLVASANELIPPRHRARTAEIMGMIDGQLKGFFRGQTTVCCCLGLMYALGLWISGVPFALLIGIAGLLASFVPYIGPMIVLIPSLLLSLLGGAGLSAYVGILGTVLVAQGLESYFLTPRIVGSKVGLGPLWIILAVMVFGSLLGFLGLLLAVPLAASLKVLVGEGLQYYRRSAIFNGSAASSETSSN